MRDVKLGLEVLLEGPRPTLWDYRTRRETSRFLRKRGKDISRRDLAHLLSKILAGPPRSHRQGIKKAEWPEYRDFEIRRHLHKLVEAGVKLPKYARKKYDRIQRDLPWEPRGDRSEEFPFFVGSGWVDRKAEGALEDFASMSIEQFVEWANLQEEKLPDRPWDCGGGWHLYVERAPDDAIRLLKGAADLGYWPLPPWYMVLGRTEKTKDFASKLVREVARMLLSMPVTRIGRIDLQAARWLEGVRKKLGKKDRQLLWKHLWDAALMQDAPEGAPDFGMTLNHAGGLLGDILYSEMASYIPRVAAGEEPGFPKPLEDFFVEVGAGKHVAAALARVRMAPMLYIINRIDPVWVAESMLSRMDPDRRDEFDPYLWEGFLWHAHWSDDFWEVLKVPFLKIMKNLELVPERIRDHAPQLFIHVAIPPERHVTIGEARAVLFNLSPSDLADAAWALKQRLEAAGKKSGTLWSDTIGPWFQHAWPKRPKDRSKEHSERLAWMAIDSGDAFPDIVADIESMIVPEEWETTVFHLASRDKETGIVSRFPKAALRLVGKLVGDDLRTGADRLTAVLSTIEAADPVLCRNKTFRRLLALAQ